MKKVAGLLTPACIVLGMIVLNAVMLNWAIASAAEDTTTAPPKGSTLIAAFAADGVQIYACEAKDGGFVWAFKAPEANLFDQNGRQVGTHFAGPTWKLFDGSALAGEVIAKSDAPEAGAIPWLLLKGKNHEGSGALSAAAYVRRADTRGGAAPKSGCDASHVGEQARMRYSANYQYFAVPK
jgi:Protein of unknown function (DUF3455)